MTDRQTDGQMDGGDCNIPDAFLKKRVDKYPFTDYFHRMTPPPPKKKNILHS